MPRTVRVAPAGVLFHVFNRANARARIFDKDLDYEAFLRIIGETARLIPVEIFAYTIMPNHWHMVLRPIKDRDLGHFIQRLTTTHFVAGISIGTAWVADICIRGHISHSRYRTMSTF